MTTQTARYRGASSPPRTGPLAAVPPDAAGATRSARASERTLDVQDVLEASPEGDTRPQRTRWQGSAALGRAARERGFLRGKELTDETFGRLLEGGHRTDQLMRLLDGNVLSIEQARRFLASVHPGAPETSLTRTRLSVLPWLLLHSRASPEERRALVTAFPAEEQDRADIFLSTAPTFGELVACGQSAFRRTLDAVKRGRPPQHALSSEVQGRRYNTAQLAMLLMSNIHDRAAFAERLSQRWNGEGDLRFLLALMPQRDRDHAERLFRSAPSDETSVAALLDPVFADTARELIRTSGQRLGAQLRMRLTHRALHAAHIREAVTVVEPAERLDILHRLLDAWSGEGELEPIAWLMPTELTLHNAKRLIAQARTRLGV